MKRRPLPKHVTEFVDSRGKPRLLSFCFYPLLDAESGRRPLQPLVWYALYDRIGSDAERRLGVECGSSASRRQRKRADILDTANLDHQRTLGTSVGRLLGHVTTPRLGRGDLCAILDGSEAHRREVEE